MTTVAIAGILTQLYFLNLENANLRRLGGFRILQDVVAHREGVMKITADNLVGSARKISVQRNSASESEKSESSVKPDRAEIASRVDSRIESISGEMRDVQTRLSLNQSIRQGMNEIEERIRSGKEYESVIGSVTFDGKKILSDFLESDKKSFNEAMLSSKNEEIDSLIKTDVNMLSKLQVETENIFASNLASSKNVETLNSILSENVNTGKNVYSQLNPEAVMRLVK